MKLVKSLRRVAQLLTSGEVLVAGGAGASVLKLETRWRNSTRRAACMKIAERDARLKEITREYTAKPEDTLVVSSDRLNHFVYLAAGLMARRDGAAHRLCGVKDRHGTPAILV